MAKANLYAKRVAAAVLLLLCLLKGLDVSDRLVMELNSAYHDPGLPRGGADVSFIGTSHAYCGVIPQLLMDEYGVTAMDHAIPLLLGRDTVPLLRLVAEESAPKIAVIDLYGFMGPYTATEVNTDVAENKTEAFYISHERLAQSRSWLDWKKYRLLANDLRTLPEALPYASPTYMLHSRFATSPGQNLYYGYAAVVKTRFLYMSSTNATRALSAFGGDPDVGAQSNPATLYQPYYAMLDEMVAIGKAYDIRLIFTLLPHPRSEEELILCEQIKDYLAREDVDFVDIGMVADGSGLVAQTDFMDGVHLNYAGAMKVTRFWGEYLTKRYSLPDRRLDDSPIYDRWKAYPRSYEGDAAASLLPGTEDAQAYVGLLSQLSANHLTILVCDEAPRGAAMEASYQSVWDCMLRADGDAGNSRLLIFKGNEPYADETFADELLYLDYIANDGFKVAARRGGSLDVCVNNERVNVPGRGVTVVIYDLLGRRVIDSVRLSPDASGVTLLRGGDV